MFSIFQNLPLIFLLFLGAVNISAQDLPTTKSEITKDKKCSLADSYNDFIQIEYKKFSFCIPIDLKEQNVKCIDSFCKEFKNEKMILTIDADPNAGIPVLERTNLSYQENTILVDNRKVWLWYFEQDHEYKYLSGANFWSEKHDYYDLGMFLSYKDLNQKETVEKIIKSVRFK